MPMPVVYNLGPNSTGLPGLMLQSAPVGLWIPQHGWTDQTPYGYNGTDTAVTYSGDGPFARMPVVPGVFTPADNSVVQLGTMGTLGSQASISFECWFKTTMAVPGTLMQATNSGGGEPNQFAVMVSTSKSVGGLAAGKIFVGRKKTNSYATESFMASTPSSVGCDDGNWHHVVGIVTHSTATIQIYFDGELVPNLDYYSSRNAIASPIDWTGRVVLGNYVYSNVVGGLDSNANRYTGSIAMAAFYAGALQHETVKAHYFVGVNGP